MKGLHWFPIKGIARNNKDLVPKIKVKGYKPSNKGGGGNCTDNPDQGQRLQLKFWNPAQTLAWGPLLLTSLALSIFRMQYVFRWSDSLRERKLTYFFTTVDSAAATKICILVEQRWFTASATHPWVGIWQSCSRASCWLIALVLRAVWLGFGHSPAVVFIGIFLSVCKPGAFLLLLCFWQMNSCRAFIKFHWKDLEMP